MKNTLSSNRRFLASIIAAVILFAGSLSVISANAAADRDTLQNHLNKATFSYLQIHDALASDSTNGISEKANALVKSIDATIALAEENGEGDALTQALKRVKQAALRLRSKTLGLADARETFANLSDATVPLISEYFLPRLASQYYVFSCPMNGRRWVQTSRNTRNPYYGRQMLQCGDFTRVGPSRVSQSDGESPEIGADSRGRDYEDSRYAKRSNRNRRHHQHYNGCGHYGEDGYHNDGCCW